MKYTIGQLKTAVHEACPNRCASATIALAMAISLAENPGMDTDTDSKPNRDGSIDRGPFQINSKAHAEVSDDCAHDLRCAAKAAYTISQGYRNFTPWTTYRTGAYRAHTADAAKAVPGAISDNTQGSGILGTGVGPDVLPGASETVGSTAAALGNIANALEKLVEGLFSSALWFRVGKVLVGLFLGAAGLIILIRKAGINPPIPIPV